MKRYGLMLSCEEYKEYDDICYCHSDALLLQETLVNYCDYGYSQHILMMTLPLNKYIKSYHYL